MNEDVLKALINELDLDTANLEKIERIHMLYMDLREQYLAETDEAVKKRLFEAGEKCLDEIERLRDEADKRNGDKHNRSIVCLD